MYNLCTVKFAPLKGYTVLWILTSLHSCIITITIKIWNISITLKKVFSCLLQSAHVPATSRPCSRWCVSCPRVLPFLMWLDQTESLCLQWECVSLIHSFMKPLRQLLFIKRPQVSKTDVNSPQWEFDRWCRIAVGPTETRSHLVWTWKPGWLP